MRKRKAIVIVGPTASGKTALSLDVAEAVAGEIISADSRQVYKGLDIGAAKIRPEEMRSIPHHLLNVADPNEVFTAADYVRLGTAALENIHGREKMSVVVGGTGFYIDALLGRAALAKVPPNHELRKQLEDTDLETLQKTLKKLDPERYATIDLKNPRRLVRAIEIARSSFIQENTTMNRSAFDALWIGVTLPKEKLRENIRVRLFARVREGMLEEAKKLHTEGLSYERMEEFGLEYRYMARHLQGFLTEAEMLEQIEKETVQYAKRQMTWFERNKEIQWFKPDEKEKILEMVRQFTNRAV